MLSRRTLFTFFFLSSLVSATTIQQENCTIIGDTDIYGRGIRLGLYLQWTATVLAHLVAPDQINNIRVLSNTLAVALFINLFRNAGSGDLIVVEWPIFWEMTLGLFMWNFPWPIYNWPTGARGLGFMLMIWGIECCAQPWLWFRGVAHGRAPGCHVYIWIFRAIEVYGQWRTFMKVSSIGAFCVGLTVFMTGVCVVCYGIFQGVTDHEMDDDDDYLKFPTPWAPLLIIFGAFSIATIEMIIKVNHIQLDAPLTDSGQLIPFVSGICAIVAVLTSMLDSCSGKGRRRQSRHSTDRTWYKNNQSESRRSKLQGDEEHALTTVTKPTK